MGKNATKFLICAASGAFAMILGLASATLAAPHALPLGAQATFRQAVYDDYSKQMAKAGAYDEIKNGGHKPKIRILDCLGERCLLDVVIDPSAPSWNSMLYVVTIRDNALVGDMTYISPYGTRTNKAAFVALGGSNMATFIYVASRTHMGMHAEQLFDMNDLSKQIAIATFYNKKPQDKEGAIHYFVKARQTLRKMGNPFEF